MKITIGDVLNFQDSLNRLSEVSVVMKETVRLKRLLKKFGEELEIYESSRKDLISKYGKIEDNKFVCNDPAKEGEFYKKFDELLAVEINIDFEPVEININDPIKMSAKDLTILEGRFITINDKV